ncbi:MAG: sigma-70 family RNA polymerase sigma factor [Chloroflexota bacterium]|nr:sigma-70 family RNA polymerase sigma factor [Chloroflexota bacterium]
MDRAEEDEQLIGRLVAGDVAALDALYDRYAGVVFALVLRIVADRPVAEELLQETFLRAWQRAGLFEGSRGRVPSWLLGIAHNLAIDELRRRRRRPQAVTPRERETAERELAGLPDPGPAVAEEAWSRLRRAQIEAALGRLPAAQRRIIELAYFEGYSQSEIAARLGEPLGTVKTRMRLGMRKLRDLLEAQGLAVETD